jgi:hypothetical protein
MFAVIHRETTTTKITAELMLRACQELRPTVSEWVSE